MDPAIGIGRLGPDGTSDRALHDVAAIRHGSRTWAVLRRDPWFWLGLAIVASLVTVAILAPLLAPHDPMFQYRKEGLTPAGDPLGPGDRFPLGTDKLGRDYLSRLLFGARTSLAIAFIANSIASLIGLTVGATAAFVGSPRVRIPLTRRRIRVPVEGVLMRLTDLALSFPVLLLAIALGSVVGQSLWLVIAVISSILWATTARIIYGRVLVLRDAPFVEAARAVGCGSARILRRQILPHVLPLVVVYSALGIAASILFETTLTYLGAGVPGATPTWGTLLNDNFSYYRTVPLLVVLPGFAVTLTVLGFTLLGDALRDALDPRARPGPLG